MEKTNTFRTDDGYVLHRIGGQDGVIAEWVDHETNPGDTWEDLDGYPVAWWGERIDGEFLPDAR